MSSNKDDTITRIKSVSGADERARTILESCDCNASDPEFASLLRHAATGDGEHSRVLASLLRPLKAPRGRNKAERRFDRIRPHHPAMGSLKHTNVKDVSLGKIHQSPGDQQPWDPSDKPHSFKPDPGFGQRLAAYIYEHSREMWPHLPELKFEPPPGYCPRGPVVNPFRTRPPSEFAGAQRMRGSYLNTTEVQKIYNAMAYAMWKDGIVMNTHVIIIWSMMGLSESEGSAILGRYLQVAQKWLRVGTKSRRRRVANARTGTELRYVWVHENAVSRGFHSHVLLHLPFGMKKDFENWSRAYFVKHIGRHFPWKAFRLVPSYAKTEHDQVRSAWRWFRYLTKQLHPDAKFRWLENRQEYHERNTRDILKPWSPRESPPVPWMKLTGVSHNIGEGCQRSDQFVSRLSQCDFESLYSGYELEERRRRILYERRTTELLATLQI